MCEEEKGYFDYTADEWIAEQYGEEEISEMAEGEYDRLVELEEQEREFLSEYLDNL